MNLPSDERVPLCPDCGLPLSKHRRGGTPTPDYRAARDALSNAGRNARRIDETQCTDGRTDGLTGHSPTSAQVDLGDAHANDDPKWED